MLNIGILSQADNWLNPYNKYKRNMAYINIYNNNIYIILWYLSSFDGQLFKWRTVSGGLTESATLENL